MRIRGDFPVQRETAVVAVLLSVLALIMALPPSAAADTTALTDDRSVSTPTGWWLYPDANAAFLTAKAAENGARITDVEVSGTGLFTATMVRDTGAYAVPDWWWYPALTEAEVTAKITEHQGRLIDIEPHLVDGAVRFAVVLVSNTGSAARTWWWWPRATPAFIAERLAETGTPKRLVALDGYAVDGGTSYAVVMVANTGADAKPWQYWFNQSPTALAEKISAFGGRITTLDRADNGNYNVVLVRNAGADEKYWRHYLGLSSSTQALDLALQHNARIVDIEEHHSGGQPVYSVVLIDNVAAESRRLTGIFETGFDNPATALPDAEYGFYLKRVGANEQVFLHRNKKWEPASAIKAVHNFEVIRRVAGGTDSLDSDFVFYNYPNSPYNKGTSSACPIPEDETQANQVTRTLDWGRTEMMRISDNRTTRGIVLRYQDVSAIQNAAALAGMKNTTIHQENIGCAWLNGKRNSTTLVDMGVFYESIERGLLLSPQHRDAFFGPMNTANAELRAVVQQEADALGKGAVVADFLSRMRNHHKAGGYNIPCTTEQGTTCTSGHLYVRTIAGRLALPVKTGASTYGERPFVYGWFVNNLHYCSGCATTAFDQTVAHMRGELFREQVRSALLTW
ncbi:serine hydrolase [Actinokineospora iranica]|uniref:Beta-lactamase enzyme family protein n=1 Tax=Actinokineospora iranica TaxID=1271860 RepID=A0A1G6MWE9_9PSEU|nr:serine hydrolase [Actinokineospora iranica]SDC59852.1 Beta-lactamase enzyme family protein [Actinokineospora iranica]